ncbi:unnamed protein product [Bursaphelenchus xylophilus]|uniref:(pine wood nematode) hypothetical protein n=1 Tax=Bursaphelenchus xylophilus TaxID=6326 RepID=A0A1I7SWB9_BURXY|nr:unnamed protein product [Bursaphelenchus xylophilus]CAG9099161.1 unnamed protein product [Bursaphelenchus xylophilus]
MEPTEAAEIPKEPEYIVVSESPTGDPIELPANPGDNSLGLATLTHAFPGAHGLKYKNPANGATRALLTDPSGTKFFAPSGGWADKLFIVIYQNEPAKRLLPGDQNPKRKKMMDDSITSDSDGESGLHHGGQVNAKLKRLNEEDDPRNKQNKEVFNKSDESGDSDKTGGSKEPKLPCSDLIVLGLPYKCTEKELREYFERFGKVVLCEIKKDQKGESRGFGFIQMDNIEQQSAVLNAEHTIGSRKCQVKLPGTKGDVKPEDLKIFVGRLTSRISSSRLREFFLTEAKKIDPTCKINDVFIPNPFRSFGFVTLSNAYVAKVLLKKEDFIIDDVSVCISPAAPKVPANVVPPQLYGRAGYVEGPIRQVWEHQEIPRRHYRPEVFDAHSPLPSGSNSLATGLETLNLNNMNADAMNAQWKVYWSAGHGGHGSATPPGQQFIRGAAPPPGLYPLPGRPARPMGKGSRGQWP